MTGQQLKNSILQLAIQGKLVPQIESEGTAEDLLKEIRAEKEKLVKEGKLKKKDLEVKPIEDDEIPFEIPESWKWVRIGDIFLHASGKQLAGGKDKGMPREYITTSNLYWNRFVLDTVKTMCFTDEEVQSSSATKGDLLVCEGGAGYGRSAIWPYDYDICLQNHVHRLRPLFKGASEYVYYIMYLLKESNQIDSVGTAMPGLSAGKLKLIPVPLPPLSEQKRIVAKIEELMPLVEEYGKAQERLETLNRELPEKLKKSVLQEAIMGKLVPQDPTEGTAEELLAEIRKEKEKLVKEGKLKKKDLEVKPIEDDEIPFEIPEGWRWVRGRFLFAPMQSIKPQGETFKYIDIDAIDNKRNEHIVKNIITSNAPSRASRKTQKGDILFSMVRPYLKNIAIVKEDDCIASTGFFVCRPYIIDIQYCFRMLLSSYVIDGLTNDFMKGDNSPSINNDDFLNYLFPLPPLAEQKRIVAKLEEVMREIEGMK